MVAWVVLQNNTDKAKENLAVTQQSSAAAMLASLPRYPLNSNVNDVMAMVVFGVVGYGLRRNGFDLAPLLLAFVLGSLLEQNVRQALLIGYGSPMIFLQKPIAAVFLSAAAISLLYPLLQRALRRLRNAV